MAEDEDGASDKKSSQNSNNGATSQETEQNTAKPDLGIEEEKYNITDNGRSSPTESRSSTSRSAGGTRKEDNPFSFRHFLKRDLSLPGNSTYESTGARPKVYASTVQPSPTREPESRRERVPAVAPEPDQASSSSSVEIPFGVVDNSDSKHNLYSESGEAPFYHRPNLATEPLGMPSLPDFVQDHILVEQAYLNPNGPLTVDLDNLPDFTFNTSFNAGSSSSGRRGREYDYSGAVAGAEVPLDLPPHLSLDLTESVNPVDRRNMSPHNSFPLDLPPNAGAESMRLPDFLPVHPGRTSPEPEHQDEQLQQIISELERTRCELFAERSRRCRVEEELSTAREEAARLRAELAAARPRPASSASSVGAGARPASSASSVGAGARPASTASGAGAPAAASAEAGAGARARDDDASDSASSAAEVESLRSEVSSLRGEAAAARSERARLALDLRRAAARAHDQLRELLSGVEQLKCLSTSLEPT